MTIAARLAAKRSRERIEAAERRLRDAEVAAREEAEQEVARVVARLTSEVRSIEFPPGAKGKDGDPGARGPRGPKGDKGEKGDPPAHRWRGTALQFEQPDGSWGKAVNLLGPAGRSGTGGGGSGTGDGTDLGALPEAGAALPAEFVVRQGDTWARATLAQMREWIDTTHVDGGAASSVYLPTESIDGGAANG